MENKHTILNAYTNMEHQHCLFFLLNKNVRIFCTARINGFLDRSNKNSGCYGNLYFPKTYNGKRGNSQCFSQWGYFYFFFQKCLLGSPLRFLRLLSKLLNLIGCRVIGFFSETVMCIKLIYCILVYDISI